METEEETGSVILEWEEEGKNRDERSVKGAS